MIPSQPTPPSVSAETPQAELNCYLNKKAVAQQLKVTVRTIENWQKRGVLPFLKIGKVVLFYWPSAPPLTFDLSP